MFLKNSKCKIKHVYFKVRMQKFSLHEFVINVLNYVPPPPKKKLITNLLQNVFNV